MDRCIYKEHARSHGPSRWAEPAVLSSLANSYNVRGTAALTYAQVSPTRLVSNSLRLMLCVALAMVPAANASDPPQPVAGPVRAQHLTVELLPLHDSIQPGGNDLVGLHFTLDKGWHVYWINAGDSGEPPTVKWTLPPGITAGAMQFPAPRRLPLGPLMDFGYEDEVLFPSP